MGLILAGVGGAFGSLVRYMLGRVINEKFNSGFPLGTLIINITGAILLGAVSSLDAGKNVYLLLGDGFLGAYTTFSTFMYEGFSLFKDNKRVNALTYIIGTFLLGVAGYFCGLKAVGLMT